ncbi:hypothetical protein LQW54_007457 [Pestalotiopsis sp. IQ-011]
MGIDEIDALLERYLLLLDEYTTLHANLSAAQSGIYQNIARANFSAERGMRFGQDHYDDRMQASRKLEVTMNDDGRPTFKLAVPSPSQEERQSQATELAVDSRETIQEADAKSNGSHNDRATPVDSAKATRRKDPLQWFGLLTPIPLRQAQAQSIKAVEQIIPRLVTVNAEMEQVEIAVRRARKKRGKAEVAAKKLEEAHQREDQPKREVAARH